MNTQLPYPIIDCHIHILPGVDDGAADMEMALAMLRIAAENQIGSMILTPHNHAGRHSASPESQMRRMRALARAGYEAGIPITLYPGNECYYDATLPERLRAGEVMTMAGSNYLLVEFNPAENYRVITNGLRSLSYYGYRVILAHVERYACVVEHPTYAEELVRSGVYLQVNAGSVVPRILGDRQEQRFVKWLLDRYLVSMIGTDAHRPVGRAPCMDACVSYLLRHYDGDYVQDLLHDHAMQVIRNEYMRNE